MFPQASLAYKLKKQRDMLAHDELISDNTKDSVYNNIRDLLATFPGTREQVDRLELATVYGARHFLKPSKLEQDRGQEVRQLQAQVDNLMTLLYGGSGGVPEKEGKEKAGASEEEKEQSDELYYSDDEDENYEDYDFDTWEASERTGGVNGDDTDDDEEEVEARSLDGSLLAIRHGRTEVRLHEKPTSTTVSHRLGLCLHTLTFTEAVRALVFISPKKGYWSKFTC